MVPGCEPLSPRWGVEVGRLGCDPVDKLADSRIGAHGLDIVSEPSEFGIGEVGVDGFVADRMNGHSAPPFLRFGHRMMPLDQRFERATTQPTGEAFVAQNGSARPVS